MSLYRMLPNLTRIVVNDSKRNPSTPLLFTCPLFRIKPISLSYLNLSVASNRIPYVKNIFYFHLEREEEGVAPVFTVMAIQWFAF